MSELYRGTGGEESVCSLGFIGEYLTKLASRKGEIGMKERKGEGTNVLNRGGGDMRHRVGGKRAGDKEGDLRSIAIR